MRLTIPTLLIALAASSGVAHAELHTNGPGKVSVDIPSSWKVKIEKGGVMTGASKDDAVGLLFWVVEKASADDAIKLLDKALAGKLSNVKWPHRPEKANINGLNGIKNVGTGVVNGKDAFIMIAVVGPTPTKKGVIVFGMIEQSKLLEHKAELTNIFDSLTPTE